MNGAWLCPKTLGQTTSGDPAFIFGGDEHDALHRDVAAIDAGSLRATGPASIALAGDRADGGVLRAQERGPDGRSDRPTCR